MSVRKHRIRVVLDTNVFVRNFKTRSKSSVNRRIIRLWLLERRLQLIVSREIVAEYLEIFECVLAMSASTVDEWRERFEADSRATMVRLSHRHTESRDSDDNEFLSTAHAGKARYLISNDRDLLDLPAPFQRSLAFTIVSPRDFLALLDEEK